MHKKCTSPFCIHIETIQEIPASQEIISFCCLSSQAISFQILTRWHTRRSIIQNPPVKIRV